jgi:N-[(2S)-2-amino-2-carboxyethyl]-L-glutamate dehydrogenase
MKSFTLIPYPAIQEFLDSNRAAVLRTTRHTYLAYGAQRAVNPDSLFLPLPEGNRIIALPASVHVGDSPAIGIKWISSFPKNIQNDLPRASAVIVTNDPVTGRPLACLEGSAISAARTAASAALALLAMRGGNNTVIQNLAVIGAGLISRTVLDYMVAAGFSLNRLTVHDLSASRAQAFLDSARTICPGAIALTSSAAMHESDVALFATTAASPHVKNLSDLGGCQSVLHLSLRDLAPEIILGCDNYVDDEAHAIRANTSLHLTHQVTKSASFITGNMQSLLGTELPPPTQKPRVFSPFGLGCLDIALAQLVTQGIDPRHVVSTDNFHP